MAERYISTEENVGQAMAPVYRNPVDLGWPEESEVEWLKMDYPATFWTGHLERDNAAI